MNKKHFEAIAAILKAKADQYRNSSYPDAYDRFAAVDAIADDLAEYFASQNPRFDELKFLQACGVCD